MFSNMRLQITLLVFLLGYVQCSLPKGYIASRQLGYAYRLMYNSKSWPAARERCEEDGGHLAIPKSQEEFNFLQKLVRAMHYPSVTDSDNKTVVWLGISNIDDYRIWKNLHGEDIKNTGFSTFAGDNGKGYSDDPQEPHCVVMDAINVGLRDWWCHRLQPFICQINLTS